MRRFIRDINKYRNYIFFQAKQDLKTEVANSYLNWIWWVLDPLFYMLIYSFVSVIVFRTTEPYFPVFVFIGLSLWEFFNRMIVQSVKIVGSNKSIVTKVYIPKYILIMNRVLVNGFKMAISFILVFGMILIYRVPLTARIFLIIPIVLNMVLVTFSLCTIVAHCGVFINDLQHVLEIVLKFLFYFTGIFYSIPNRIPGIFADIMLKINPVAFHINALRNVMIYDAKIDLVFFLIWTFLGIVCSTFGIRMIYRHENTYVKMI